jgi:predicted transcriptional regulator
MAKATKVREINIVEESGAFQTFFKKLTGEHTNYDFEGIHALRQLLNNEKAKIMHTIKTKHPSSIYSLAKLLKRDFKSVSEDIKLLERFGFIDLIAEKSGKRERLRPILVADCIQINLKI